MPVAPELVEILACPKCHGKLTYKDDGSAFVCAACQLVYEVIEDIPNFIIEEAKPLA